MVIVVYPAGQHCRLASAVFANQNAFKNTVLNLPFKLSMLALSVGFPGAQKIELGALSLAK